MNKLNLFNNSPINLKEFLQSFWHKKPLLIHQAIDKSTLNALPNQSELIKLSENDDIQSRIVIKHEENDYAVEFGPFNKDDFEELKDYTWNLLVSDVDKWLPESRKILSYFSFIRNWILDDIMLSCGTIGGTVGPHTDHYDVFLVQLKGQRKWSFNHDKIVNPKYLADQSLKLLSNFSADETHVLNPGDVLYLPPEIAHYGIAYSDDCVTCSIGTRTPSQTELLTSYMDSITQQKSENQRFEEPRFNKQPAVGEITASDIKNISQILIENLNTNNQSVSNWFGKYITEYRSLFIEFNPFQEADVLTFKTTLTLSSFSQSCYFNTDNSVDLFVNGQHFQSSLNLAESICNCKVINLTTLNSLDKQDKGIIKILFKNGSLIHK